MRFSSTLSKKDHYRTNFVIGPLLDHKPHIYPIIEREFEYLQIGLATHTLNPVTPFIEPF